MSEQYVRDRMATIFNVWAKRYAEDPSEFGDILGDDGQPVSDYGKHCAMYFEQLAGELDEAGALPQPPAAPPAGVSADMEAECSSEP